MQTKGEYLVGLSFNPSGSGAVNDVKQQTAALIDRMDPIAEMHGVGGREAALAITAYEEAAMWAVKALTKGPRE